MMKDKKRSDSTDRRNFLKLAGLGSIAGGAALATGVSEADAKTAENKSSGYRETDHVKSFYKSARF